MAIITGLVANTTPVYFGPDASTYPQQSSTAGPNDTVVVKWQEGVWYYIDYPSGTSNRKCMYINMNAVSQLSGTPPTYTASKIAKTMVSATTTYWGPGAAYPVAGSVDYNEPVHLLGGKVENGFSLIEYYIDGVNKKRAWVMSPKLGGTPTNYDYSAATANDCALRIMRTSATNIVLTNLNRAYTLSQTGFYGINAGFFNMTGAVVTHQIADNKGFPVLYASRSLTSGNGSNNTMGYACLYWDGSTLAFSRNTTTWNQEKI